MATLQEVVDQLKVNNQGIDTTATYIKDLVESMKQSKLDNLEDKLESQRRKSATATPERSSAYNAGFNLTGGLGALMNPAGLLAPLLAGVTAFGAGIAGLRGWEVGALKSLGDNIKKIPDLVLDGAKGLRTSVLGRFFGIEVDPKTGLAKTGQMTKSGAAYLKPLGDVVDARMATLRKDFLLAFGIGADGKPIQDPKKGFKVSTTGAFITTATERINKLLEPIVKVSEGISDFVKGAGAGLYKFLEPIIGVAGGFAKVFANILKPIGFLFSAYEAVQAYLGTEGSVYDKSKAAFSMFIADFLGAPLDLLKGAVTWILKNLLGLETNEDGSVKEGQGLSGDILAAVQKFSFKDSIDAMIKGVFSLGERAFDWFKGIFSGEKSIGTALGELWTGWLGVHADIASFIWNKAIKPVTEWFGEKLGVDIELPELDVRQMLSDTYTRVKNNFLGSMENLAIWFQTMPAKIGLELEEEWILAVANLKIGFAKFGNWISGIPDSILTGALSALSFLPDWALDSLGITDALKGREAKELEQASALQASIDRINSSSADKINDLNQRRQNLAAYEQQLMDARQYNTTNVNNSGGIVLDTQTPTADPLNGGSSFAAVGGPF